jgi:Flp pilus assembly protein TadG
MNAFLAKLFIKKSGQGIVEFALILPFLLLAITGIVEFGYTLYTYVAIQEVARLGSRYAITGNFDPKYCAQAGAALGLAADDTYGGSPADCVVPSTRTNFETKTTALQDWARLPSIRDAAMAGGAGMLIQPNVSGNYLQYLVNGLTSTVFNNTNLGNPTADGYINISVCSNRAATDPNPYFYGGVVNRQNQYVGVCVVNNGTNNVYMDDAGGPGNRVRVTVTYNHPMIMPFYHAMWPNLKMTTSQDGIVEKFRTSRSVGLIGGINVLPTWTTTPTTTPTPIPTPTPVPCGTNNGTGLRASFYSGQSFATLINVRTDPTVNFFWTGGAPYTGGPTDNFSAKWEGYFSPNFSGNYIFTVGSDDGSRLYIDGNLIVNQWGPQSYTERSSSTVNLTCGQHTISLEFYEASGDASVTLKWDAGTGGAATIIPVAQLYPLAYTPMYPTITPTPTITQTPTLTPTPCPANNGTGLRGSYFGNYGVNADISAGNNENLMWTNLRKVQTDATVNFPWGNGTPFTGLDANNFQVRWEGNVSAPYPGPYTFIITTDDGGRLWVDGAQVITAWRDQGSTDSSSAVINLSCGKKTIKFEFYEHTGGATSILQWTNGTVGNKVVIAQQYLYPLAIGGLATAVNSAIPPTATNTPIPPTKTNTPIPATATQTAVPANTIPPAHSPIPTSTIAATITPTPCLTPPDLGGCK